MRRWVVIAGLAGTMLVWSNAAGGWPPPTPPNDPLYPQQQELGYMSVPAAWSYATGRGVNLALIGNGGGGINCLHEDLQDKIVAARERSQEIDCPQPRDQHDTMVAGVAAATTNNGKGIAGTAPDARLISVATHFLDRDIRWAADNGAHVLFIEFARISTGIPDLTGLGEQEDVLGADQHFQEALQYAWDRGAVILGGAGNFSEPFCSTPSWYTPVVCVGALQDSRWIGEHSGREGFEDQKTFYSNFGFRVPIFAPGLGFGPTWNSNDQPPYNRYEQAGGTSNAVAYAAGVAALLIERGADNEETVRLLKCTADDLGPPGPDLVYGYGRINALRAVKAVGSGITCPELPQDAADLLPPGP